MISFFLRYLREHPKLLLWALFGLTAAALLLTLMPADYLSRSKLWSYDKLGHILLFGGWTYLLGLYMMFEYPDRHNLWKIFSMGIIFGGVVELLQYLLPINRHGDILDFCVDAIGAIGAVLLLKITSRIDNE